MKLTLSADELLLIRISLNQFSVATFKRELESPSQEVRAALRERGDVIDALCAKIRAAHEAGDYHDDPLDYQSGSDELESVSGCDDWGTGEGRHHGRM